MASNFKKARVIQDLPTTKRGGNAILSKDMEYKVTAIDEKNNKVYLLDPINPAVVHEFTLDAVELFDEVDGIWKSLKGLWKSIKNFFGKWLKRK